MNEPASDGHRSEARLPRAFRLKKQGLIRPLFDRRRRDVGSTAHGCIRLVYRVVSKREAGTSVPVLVGFTAGRGGTAPRRNRIKRVLREVYRVHQTALVDLFSDGERTLTMMILYRRPVRGSDERCVQTDLPKALATLAESFNETSMSEELPD